MRQSFSCFEQRLSQISADLLGQVTETRKLELAVKRAEAVTLGKTQTGRRRSSQFERPQIENQLRA
jgi:hypothetical protein